MSKTLTDLAKELLSRGVYCVLNANTPRDIGPRTTRRKGHAADVEMAVTTQLPSGGTTWRFRN